MKKVRVIITFEDKHTGKLYTSGNTIEVTEKRESELLKKGLVISLEPKTILVNKIETPANAPANVDADAPANVDADAPANVDADAPANVDANAPANVKPKNKPKIK